MAGLTRCEPKVSGRMRPSKVMKLTQRKAKVNSSGTSEDARAPHPTDQEVQWYSLPFHQRTNGPLNSSFLA